MERSVAGHRVEARPMRVEEAGGAVDHFLHSSDADLQRMGVVPRDRLPSRASWLEGLQASVQAQGPPSFYYAWLVDGVPIGHCALKGLVEGQNADIHLHIWRAAVRGKGLGAVLFCQSVVDAYRRFGLKTLACEPSAGNPMPNRMLQKVGFPSLGTRVGASSELSAVTTLNRYDVRRDVAQGYLDRLSPDGVPER